MVANLCLLACALSVAQPPERSSWLLQPQLARGQEFTYSGTFTEEAKTPGVLFQRSYRLDQTVCVLDVSRHTTELAFLTVMGLRTSRAPREAGPTSVRLELAELDEHGQIRGRPGANLAVPLEGPPTLECGMFIAGPASQVRTQQFWEASEPGRPPHTWRVVGTEAVAGLTCVKLVGQQQSDDWTSPRGDSSAWKRQDTVWVAPQLGIAYRLERIVERRDPAHDAPTHRAVLRYELDSRLTYPGELFTARRQEILHAQKFSEEAAPLLRQPGQHKPQIEAALKRIGFYLEAQPPTPYRKAIAQIQHRLEAARRGEVAPETAMDTTTAAASAALGRPAPDFIATDLLKGQSMRLQRLLGRPLLLCFYDPHTSTGDEVLRFAQGLCEEHGSRVQIVGMAVTEDAEAVRKQHAELRLSFPILEGNGLHTTYGVEATPRLVLIDAGGIVRGLYTGWGAHSSREIREDVQRWLK